MCRQQLAQPDQDREHLVQQRRCHVSISPQIRQPLPPPILRYSGRTRGDTGYRSQPAMDFTDDAQ
jgi:hypothetical protein